MAIGQMVDGAGCHDMLAAHCKCMQCGLHLTAISYERRVAHVKKCESGVTDCGQDCCNTHPATVTVLPVITFLL